MGNVIVANTNLDHAKQISAVLRSAGIPVAAVCTTAAQLLRLMEYSRWGVVVCGVTLSEMPAIQQLRNMRADYLFLYIVRGLPPEALDDPCLVMPLNRGRLAACVHMLVQISESSGQDLKQRMASSGMDEKEILFRAKEQLMAQCNMSEPSAHRFLQKRSMDSGKRLCEIAILVLDTLNRTV